MNKKLLRFLMVGFILAGIISVQTRWDGIALGSTTSGTIYSSATWTYDDSSATLAINGSYSMAEIEYINDWKSFIGKVKTISITNCTVPSNMFSDIQLDCLEKIELHNTTLMYSAFKDLEYLKELEVYGCCDMGAEAFSKCIKLTSVDFYTENGKNQTSLGKDMFYGCKKLTAVTLPDTLTTIGDEAFYNCTALKQINIPSGVTSIGDSAFRGCTALSSVTIPSGVTAISDKTFYLCSSLSNITIPSGVTTIGEHAFYKCGLTSLTISASVTSLGASAFASCSSLTSLTLPAAKPSYYGLGVFSDCSKITDIYYGGTRTQFYSYYETDFLLNKNYTLHVDKITDLSTCTVTLEYTSTNYYEYVPKELYPAVTVEDNYDKLDSSYYNVTYSNNLYPGTATVTISSNCADFCGTKTVTFQINGPEIKTSGSCGDDAEWTYDKSTRVLTVNGTGTVNHSEDWNNFYWSIKKVVINEGITEIGYEAFSRDGSYYPGFTEVSLPSTLKSIKESAFMQCENLQSITIPEGVTTLGYYAFAYCTSLTTVYFKPTDSSEFCSGEYIFGYRYDLFTGEVSDYNGMADTSLKDVYCDVNADQLRSDFSIVFPDTCTGHYNISGCNAYINENCYYTGKTIKPNFTVEDGYNTLTKNKDYKVTYSNNIHAGTATATITGIGNYHGSFTTKFKIYKASSPMKAKLSATVIYSGKTAKITVSGNKGTVSYTVKDSDTGKKNICKVTGSGKVTGGTISAKGGFDHCSILVKDSGTSDYKSKTVTLRLEVKKCGTPVVSLKNTSKGPKITWTKTKGACEWCICRQKKGSSKWETIVSSTKTCSYVDKKAANKKIYRYKVRCINSNIGCACSSYSASQQITVKK